MAYYPPEFVERIRHIKRLQEERFLPLRLIKVLLDEQGGGPVPRAEVAERFAMPANVLDRLEEIGVLTPGPGGYDPDDVKIIEAIARFRAGGYDEALGFTVYDTLRYREALQPLVEEEVRVLLERLSGDVEPDARGRDHALGPRAAARPDRRDALQAAAGRVPEAAMSEAFYEPLGDGRFRSTGHTAGPWDVRSQHAGPPAALLGRALEGTEPREGTLLARVTFEILGPVPVAEVEVESRVLRPGRTVELLEAQLSAGGRPVDDRPRLAAARHEAPAAGDDARPAAAAPGRARRRRRTTSATATRSRSASRRAAGSTTARRPPGRG